MSLREEWAGRLDSWAPSEGVKGSNHVGAHYSSLSLCLQSSEQELCQGRLDFLSFSVCPPSVSLSLCL